MLENNAVRTLLRRILTASPRLIPKSLFMIILSILICFGVIVLKSSVWGMEATGSFHLSGTLSSPA